MTAEEVLLRCREALRCARQQREVVAWLKAEGNCDWDPAPEARALLAYLEDTARLYGERAMAILSRLPPGREYSVLMRYYVLGDSMRQIAGTMGCDIRTATRAKARGLNALCDYEREDRHEQDADYRQPDAGH